MSKNDSQVTVVGAVVSEPETRQFDSGDEVTEARIAEETNWKSNDEWQSRNSYYTVKGRGYQADDMKDLVVGNQVFIRGSLKQERWESDGENRSRVVIQADVIIHFDDVDSGQNFDEADDDLPF